MLDSVKIQRRQSEIRQALAALVGKTEPTEDETRQMGALDAEYRANETRYRAALIAEDTERREAGAELADKPGREWADLVGRFEMRQAALALDEGRALDGATAEIVAELRQAGGYRGVPIPLEALEIRAGETIASGTPDPVQTRPIIDRIFARSAASQMGISFISIPQGTTEWPITTGGAAVGWQATETGSVGAAAAFGVAERSLAPDYTLGCQMKVTRKALRQSGAGLEQAIRRDMSQAIRSEIDRAIFQGSGSSGQPEGLMNLSGSPDPITKTAVSAAATYATFLAEMVEFMKSAAITDAAGIRMLARPEVLATMEADLISSTAVSEYDRLVGRFSAPILTTNAIPAPSGSPLETEVLLATNSGGVPWAVAATWGALDLIRDPYSDAASGGLRLTALITTNWTYTRGEQARILTAVRVD